MTNSNMMWQTFSMRWRSQLTGEHGKQRQFNVMDNGNALHETTRASTGVDTAVNVGVDVATWQAVNVRVDAAGQHRG